MSQDGVSHRARQSRFTGYSDFRKTAWMTIIHRPRFRINVRTCILQIHIISEEFAYPCETRYANIAWDYEATHLKTNQKRHTVYSQLIRFWPTVKRAFLVKVVSNVAAGHPGLLHHLFLLWDMCRIATDVLWAPIKMIIKLKMKHLGCAMYQTTQMYLLMLQRIWDSYD